jgi:hypothetical protein
MSAESQAGGTPVIGMATLATAEAASLAEAVMAIVLPPAKTALLDGAETLTVGGVTSVVNVPPPVDAKDGSKFRLVVELTRAVPVVKATLAAPPVVLVEKVIVPISWSPLTGVILPRAMLITPLPPVLWAWVPKADPV